MGARLLFHFIVVRGMYLGMEECIVVVLVVVGCG